MQRTTLESKDKGVRPMKYKSLRSTKAIGSCVKIYTLLGSSNH
jgi:hypothetical protein